MAEDSIISDEMRAIVDKESDLGVVEVERGAVRQYARSAQYTNPVYYEVEVARAAGYPDLPCPPGFFGRFVFVPGKSDDTFSSPLVAENFPSGIYTKILNGGMRTRIYRRIFAGETLNATVMWTNLKEREGSLGKMLIVDNVTTFRDATGKTVAESAETTIRYS